MTAARVRLIIGTTQSRVLSTTADGRHDTMTLAIGVDNVRPGTFSTQPPHPSELEAAIEYVENVVMPLARRLPRDAVLAVEGELPREVKALRDIDDVEARFNSVVAVAYGGPITDAVLSDQRHASAVLILREFMHHLGFGRLLTR
ncbi:hypothetical protein JJQ59_22440 [Cupriavidus necator]|nr:MULTISPECIES: hypothetical protein [Cupriavidus]QQX88156.1 hypothetical protein JJQ59_22440 [Cupriavidus necator]